MSKSLVLCGIVASCATPPQTVSPEVAGAIANRPTLKASFAGVRTLPLPWPPLPDLSHHADPDVQSLWQWVSQHSATLQDWPPRLGNISNAIQVIQEWQEEREKVSRLKTLAHHDASVLLLTATFLLYGYNLDEEGAASELKSLLGSANSVAELAPLAVALQALHTARANNPHAAEEIARAIAINSTTPKVSSLLAFAMSHECLLAQRFHAAAHFFQIAQTSCPHCFPQKSDMAGMIASRFSSPTDVSEEKIVTKVGRNIHISLFGLQAQLPPGWEMTQETGYDAEDGVAVFFFKSPKGSIAGLTHGITLFLNTAGARSSASAFFATLAKDAVAFEKASPLAPQPEFGKWQVFKTAHTARKGDNVVLFTVSGQLRATRWTIADHTRLAKPEQLCLRSLPPDLPQDGTRFFSASQKPRLAGNLEFLITYGASEKTATSAREIFKEFLQNLQFESHAGTEITTQTSP